MLKLGQLLFKDKDPTPVGPGKASVHLPSNQNLLLPIISRALQNDRSLLRKEIHDQQPITPKIERS